MWSENRIKSFLFDLEVAMKNPKRQDKIRIAEEIRVLKLILIDN